MDSKSKLKLLKCLRPRMKSRNKMETFKASLRWLAAMPSLPLHSTLPDTAITHFQSTVFFRCTWTFWDGTGDSNYLSHFGKNPKIIRARLAPFNAFTWRVINPLRYYPSYNKCDNKTHDSRARKYVDFHNEIIDSCSWRQLIPLNRDFLSSNRFDFVENYLFIEVCFSYFRLRDALSGKKAPDRLAPIEWWNGQLSTW